MVVHSPHFARSFPSGGSPMRRRWESERDGVCVYFIKRMLEPLWLVNATKKKLLLAKKKSERNVCFIDVEKPR